MDSRNTYMYMQDMDMYDNTIMDKMQHMLSIRNNIHDIVHVPNSYNYYGSCTTYFVPIYRMTLFIVLDH
jgi:hypothetical protein